MWWYLEQQQSLQWDTASEMMWWTRGEQEKIRGTINNTGRLTMILHLSNILTQAFNLILIIFACTFLICMNILLKSANIQHTAAVTKLLQQFIFYLLENWLCSQTKSTSLTKRIPGLGRIITELLVLIPGFKACIMAVLCPQTSVKVHLTINNTSPNTSIGIQGSFVCLRSNNLKCKVQLGRFRFYRSVFHFKGNA